MHKSNVTSSPRTPLRIVSPYITTDVSFASVVESHRAKIGKVQSTRRRHWRDVKENEREAEAKGKLRRAEVENREREGGGGRTEWKKRG